jgi:hypothetical protein
MGDSEIYEAGRRIWDKLSREEQETVEAFIDWQRDVERQWHLSECRLAGERQAKEDAEVRALRRQLAHEDVVDALRTRIKERGLEPTELRPEDYDAPV